MKSLPNVRKRRSASLTLSFQSQSMLIHQSPNFCWHHLGLSCPTLTSHGHFHKSYGWVSWDGRVKRCVTGSSTEDSEQRIIANKVFQPETLKGRVWEGVWHGACSAGWTCVLSFHLIIRKELTLPTELWCSFWCPSWKMPRRQHQSPKPWCFLARDKEFVLSLQWYFFFLVAHILDCLLIKLGFSSCYYRKIFFHTLKSSICTC